jgi:hypothetical protein
MIPETILEEEEYKYVPLQSSMFNSPT